MKYMYPLLIFGFSMSMNAQEESEKPGDITLPDSSEELAKLKDHEKGDYEYSVSDYFQRPNKYSFQFSPDGKFLSYKERDDDGKSHIYVQNTETDEIKKAIIEGEELIRGYGWANNSKLIFVKDKGGDENYHIFSANIDGTAEKDLTPYDGVRAQFSNLLKDQKDYVIVDMNKDNEQIFEPYKLNINDGTIEKLYENTDPANPIAGYDFDKNGNLKAFTKQKNGVNYVVHYRVDDESGFQPVIETSWKDDFYIIGFDYETENPHDAYVMTNVDGNTSGIILYDFEKRQILKQIQSNPTFDMGGMSRSRKRGYEVDYFYYTGEKSEIIPVSEIYKKLHAKFEKEFGDKDYSITSETDEEDKYLIYVYSDKLYGTYYLYNVVSDSFKKLVDLMPQLDEKDMAEMKPIKFKSRDGLTLYGYLTIPNGVTEGQQVPMIVNPHGGPYGPRDDWGFNPESQLFASRGYATLQVNYRGSGGYGKEFYLAGSKQIGRNMLNDLEDGVAHAVSLGFIDGEKIGIYGGSYGGLATLGSLVKTPDLYKCGVDYVGVSNLFTFYKSFPPYWKPYLEQVYEQWYDERDPEEAEIMKQVSPALNCEKITKPLFVVQGANDPRVNIDESDQVVKNLRSRGVHVPYMVKYDEGHGFGHEANRIELYGCMMGFFAQHLKNEKSM